MPEQRELIFKPIGYVRTKVSLVPRHWSRSEVEGEIIIEPQYQEGLRDIHRGEKLVVIFCFHQSPPFSPDKLIQKPPHREEALGVFSTCSPVRPNPIGLSVLDVVAVSGNIIQVRRIDMIDGTPVLDLKPYVAYSNSGEREN